jgi:hypothetical protein
LKKTKIAYRTYSNAIKDNNCPMLKVSGMVEDSFNGVATRLIKIARESRVQMKRADLSWPYNHLQFICVNICRYLASCKGCTGNYIGELLHKRFVCNCSYHKIIENNFGSAIPTVRGQESDEKTKAVVKEGGT